MNKNDTFRYKHYRRVMRRLDTNGLIPMFSFKEYGGVKDKHKLKCKQCNLEFISSFNSGKNPKCPICHPNRLTKNYGHPKIVKLKCEHCSNEFEVIWGWRNRRFCSSLCKNEAVKQNSREMVKCLNCGELFERYKNIKHWRSGKLKQYCSNYCSVTSKEKRERLVKWGSSDKNHWNNPECQQKVKITKLARYGDGNYNNMEKNYETMMEKYGVRCGFDLPQARSNGKRISKFQRKVYADILQEYPDAQLEQYLEDAEKSVDIYIPSQKKIVECFGDYWHCNPIRYKPDYYNDSTGKTAQEMWNNDKVRLEQLRALGYTVEVIWENDKFTLSKPL
jgi:hypothetical protein